MSDKTFLPLPTGNDGFAEIRTVNCYYVDKTPYLKTVFSKEASTDKKASSAGTPVMLFTRPRRFGKTLLMDMFKNFLKINSDNPDDTSVQKELFHGLKILDDKDFCKRYMGSFPVISITLKDVHGNDYEEAYKQLGGLVASKAKEFGFLKDSPKLDDRDKAKFDKLCDEDLLIKCNADSKYYMTTAIKDLSLMLYKHFNRQVYILIDEYDVPLAKAHEAHKKDFHKKMVDLMSSFLGFLKTPPTDPVKGTSIISKVIMTGCLKVAKNSIFTGVNNLKVNTVVSENEEFTGMIGFTKDETLKVLKDYEMEEYADVVKNNYDGYRFYDKEMFCPWDVINFVDDNFVKNQKVPKGNIVPGNYWAASTSSPAVYEYLGYLTDADTKKMQDLVDGKSISFRLNESMNYDCLSAHKSDDFWSLLLHTGYLILDWEKTKAAELSKDSTSNKDIFARIPNQEIKECFTDNIKDRFDNSLKNDNLALNIASALLDGNSAFIQEKLRSLLRSFVSVRDNATRAPHENYYHGFLNGIFTNCKDSLGEYHSNGESGNGYPDILFKDADFSKVAIIEIKSAPIGSDFVTLSENALTQIEEKNYAEPMMTNKSVMSIFAYGISFSGKTCAVTCKKLK